jgi:hypothetical protein
MVAVDGPGRPRPRLKSLEWVNARLKKIVAEQALEISLLTELQRGTGGLGARS